jgi:hypothetical protein
MILLVLSVFPGVYASDLDDDDGDMEKPIPASFYHQIPSVVALEDIPSISQGKDGTSDVVNIENRADVAQVAKWLVNLDFSSSNLVDSAGSLLSANAQQDGKAFDRDHWVATVFDGIRNTLFTGPANLAIDIAEGHNEDAVKNALTALLEESVDAAILAGAPETAGADLFLLFISHQLVAMAVDSIFRDFHRLIRFASNTGGKACDSSNYANSPWFFRSNEFGTDEWRDCLACCVAWSQAEHHNGSCGCCVFVSCLRLRLLFLLGLLIPDAWR